MVGRPIFFRMRPDVRLSIRPFLTVGENVNEEDARQALPPSCEHEAKIFSPRLNKLQVQREDDYRTKFAGQIVLYGLFQRRPIVDFYVFFVARVETVMFAYERNTFIPSPNLPPRHPHNIATQHYR